MRLQDKHSIKNTRAKIRQVTMLGMMLAMVVALSALEHALPPIPGLPPGMRLGLSNVVVMYAIFFVGWRQAALLAVLKSLFVMTIRGGVAGLLSFSGGMLSVLGIIALSFLFGAGVSYLALSVTGAILHNAGQIAVASALLGMSGRLVLFYLPVLIVAGVIMGIVTGTLLRVIMPLFSRQKGWER